ncbi:MAG: Spy/CpxP family protein refolding chaperone [Candidatus Binatia bacterium]
MNVFSVLLLLVGALLLNRPLYGEEGNPNPERWEHIKDRLHLSPEQLQRVREIKQRNAAEIIKLKGKLDQHVAELKNILDQEPIDQQKIETIVQEIGKIQTDKVRLQTQSIFEIRSLLNPEQKRLLKSYRRGRKEGSFLWPAFTLEQSC